jgi:hypothetical protein
MITRQPVSSSNIAEVGFDEPTQTLEVLFVGGRLYSYAHVPRAVFDALMEAPSIGSYFATAIKSHPDLYPHTSIMSPEATAPLPGQRIRSLSVGRTYNLGNYESLRIDLSWDLAPNESPAQIYRALRTQLDRLRATRLEAVATGDDDPDRPWLPAR